MPASGGIQRNGAAVIRRREIVGERPAVWIRLLARLQRLTLDRRLAAGEPAQVRGVALVRELLRDGGSPLYAAGTGGGLDRSIRRARAALLLD